MESFGSVARFIQVSEANAAASTGSLFLSRNSGMASRWACPGNAILKSDLFSLKFKENESHVLEHIQGAAMVYGDRLRRRARTLKSFALFAHHEARGVAVNVG